METGQLIPTLRIESMDLRPESGRVSQEPTSHEADQIFWSQTPSSIENDKSACVGSIGTQSTGQGVLVM